MNSSEIRGALNKTVRDLVEAYPTTQSHAVSTTRIAAPPRPTAAARESVTSTLIDLVLQHIKFSSYAETYPICLKHALCLLQHGHPDIALNALLREEVFSDISTSSIPAHTVSFYVYTNLCKFYLAVAEDPMFKKKDTISVAHALLAAACEAMRPLFQEDEHHYYHVHDCTVLIYTATLELVRRGYHSEAETILRWCAQCCNSVLSLCTIKFLPWRLRLHLALAQCAECRGDYVAARKVAADFLGRVAELRTLEVSDLVLPDDAMCHQLQAVYDAAVMLQLKYEIMSETDGNALPASASTSPAMIEKIKSTLAAAAVQGLEASPESVAKLQPFTQSHTTVTVRALLSLAWDPTARVVGIPSDSAAHRSGQSSPQETPRGGRRFDVLSGVALEALVSITTPLINKVVRPQSRASAVGTADEPKKPVPKGKGKANDVKALDADPNVMAPSMPSESLFDVVGVPEHVEIIQALFMAKNWEAFATWVEAFGMRDDLPDASLDLGARVVDFLKIVHAAIADFNLTTCTALCDALNSAVGNDAVLLRLRPDLVEDAFMLLHRVWTATREYPSEEGEDTINVFTTVARCLMAVGSSDVLLLLNVVLVAVERLEAALNFYQSQQLASTVLSYTLKWRSQYVRNSTNAPKSVLYSSVLDMRTKMLQVYVRATLKLGVEAQFTRKQQEHQHKIELLNTRKQQEHIFGALSKKEQDVYAHLLQSDVVCPISAEDAERRLRAQFTGNDAALALVALETTRFRASKKTVTPLLQAAQQHLTTAMQNGDITKAVLSVPMLLATYLSRCADWGCVDLSDSIARTFISQFVVVGEDGREVWEQNPCTKDSLNIPAVRRCSDHLARALGHAFLALAQLEVTRMPDSEMQFDENDESGVDPKRSDMWKVQQNRLHAINYLLMASQLAMATRDDSLVLQAGSAMMNAMQALITIRSQAVLVQRPLMILCSTLANVPERRWHDDNLQLLAARALVLALDGVRLFPVEFHKGFYKLIFDDFSTMYVKTLQHPNPTQIVHMNRTVQEQAHQQVILSIPQASNSTAPVAPVVGGKAGGKAAVPAPDTSAAANSAGNLPTLSYEEARTTSRNNLLPDDLLPAEWSELLCRVLFDLPGVTYLNKEQLPKVPNGYWNVANVLQRSPVTGLKEALEDQKNSPAYLKLVAISVRRVLQSQSGKGDTLKELITTAISRAKDKVTGLVVKEMDSIAAALKVIDVDGMPTAGGVPSSSSPTPAVGTKKEDSKKPPPKGAPASITTPAPEEIVPSAMTPVERAMAMMAQWVARFRRRRVYRQLRLKAFVTDVPSEGQLHYLHGIILYQEFCREKGNKGAGMMDTNATTTTAENDVMASASRQHKAPPPPPKQAKGKGAPADVAAADNASHSAPTSSAWSRQTAIVRSLTHAMVCFCRCHRWRHAVGVLQFLLNVCRSMYGTTLPSTLPLVVLPDGTQSTSASRRISRANSRAGTPRGGGGVGGSKDAHTEEGLREVESYMKQVATQINALLVALEDGKCDFILDDVSLVPSCIESGSDVLRAGGFLARTTSIALRKSQRGLAACRELSAWEDRSVAHFHRYEERERYDLEFCELEALHEIKLQEYTEYNALNPTSKRNSAAAPKPPKRPEGPVKVALAATTTTRPAFNNTAANSVFTLGEDEGPMFKGTNTMLSAMNKSTAVAAPNDDDDDGDVYQDVPYLSRMGEISLDEIHRSMFYILQCLQFSYKKDSLIALGDDFNRHTRSRYAVHLLPYLMAILNSVGRSYETFKGQYERALRNYPRTLKLMYKARRHFEANAGAGGIFGKLKYGALADSVLQYNQAIEYLRQKHSINYLITFLYELGTIHAKNKNIKDARQSWNDAIDVVFSAVDAISNWRSLVEDRGDRWVARLGVWRVIMAVTILGKLSQFVDYQDQTRAVEEVVLAGHMMKCMGNANLMMPQRAWDVGLSKAPVEVFPGVPLEFGFGALPAAQYVEVCHSMHYTTLTLLRRGFPALALPLSHTLESIATYLLRDVGFVSQARLLRLRACADMGNFDAATTCLFAIVKGSQLPDTSLTHMSALLDIDTSRIVAAVAKPAEQKKGKGAAAAAPVEAPAATDENITFHNDKPLNAEPNKRAVEAIISNLAPGEDVKAVYGDALCQDIGFYAAHLLVRIAAADAPACLEAAVEASETPVAPVKGVKGDKGGKGAKEDTSDVAVNVPALVLGKAMEVLSAYVESASASSVDVVEGHYLMACVNALKGQWLKCCQQIQHALKVCEEAMPRYQAMSQKKSTAGFAPGEAMALSQLSSAVSPVTTSPSKQATTTTTTRSDVPAYLVDAQSCEVLNCYKLLCQAMFNMNRVTEVEGCIDVARTLCSTTNDRYSLRYFSLLECVLKLMRGEALETIDQLKKDVIPMYRSLNFSSHEPDHSLCLLYCSQAHFDLLEREAVTSAATLRAAIGISENMGTSQKHTSRATSMSVRQQQNSPKGAKNNKNNKTAADMPATWLQEACDLLRKRAESYNLNVNVKEPWETLYAKHNPATYNYVQATVFLAPWLIRHHKVTEAHEVCRTALVASQQGRADLYPHYAVRLRVLLGQLERMQLTSGPEEKDMLRHWGTADCDSVGTIIAGLDDAIESLQKRVRGDAHFKMLTTAIASAITGTHEHETIRNALLELAFWFGQNASTDPACALASVRCLYLSNTVSDMVASLYHNLSDVKQVALAAVEELPQVVVNDLHETKTRENHSQTVFDAQFRENMQSADGAAAAKSGKPDKKTDASASSPAMLGSVSTLVSSTILSYFKQLTRELASPVPFDAALTEMKLCRVRAYVSRNLGPEVIDKAVLFQEAPDVLAIPDIKPNMICVQNTSLSQTLDVPERSQTEADALVPVGLDEQPRVTMMIVLCLPTAGGVDTAAQEESTPAPGTKKSENKKGGVSPMPTDSAKTRRVMPYLCALSVEQYLLHTNHVAASRLRDLLLAEKVKQEERSLWAAEQGTPVAGQGAVPAAASTTAAAPSNNPSPRGVSKGKRSNSAADMALSQSAVGGGDVDADANLVAETLDDKLLNEIHDLKGKLMFGLQHMVRRAKHGSRVTERQVLTDDEVEALSPKFTIALPHAMCLAGALDPNGGCFVEDADVVGWLHALISNA
eukprot:PhM_4_TR4100/c0_g1_i1/m.14965